MLQTFKQHGKEFKKGAFVAIELRTFNSETHEPWKKQKARNIHNLSAYYSEFIRIRIGQPGIFIDNFQKPGSSPSPNRYSGGWTTTPTARVEPWRALQQQAFNMSWNNATTFLLGRTWFHTDFVSGKHMSDPSDDKPSVFFEKMEEERAGFSASIYNVKSCNACHILNGTALMPETPMTPLHTTITKTMSPNGLTHKVFGNQLQTDGSDKEGDLVISKYEEKKVILNDGEVVFLRRPIFKIVNGKSSSSARLSPRRTPAIIGMGLLDAVPDKTLIKIASKNGGQVSKVNGKVGKFGWKASQPKLLDQIKEALRNDMGVLSDSSPLDSPLKVKKGKGLLSTKALNELEAYVALLGVPPRNKPDERNIKLGEAVFKKINCNQCHVPTLQTGNSKFKELQNQTIHPFTDLLLHDMGPGLADESPKANAGLWRTAPLWGLKNVLHATNDHRKKFRPGNTEITFRETYDEVGNNRIQLLHDGRARSLKEAILWHGGEAEKSVNLYKALSKSERQFLEAFLWDL